MDWTLAGLIAVTVVLVVRGWRRHRRRWSITFHINYDDQSDKDE